MANRISDLKSHKAQIRTACLDFDEMAKNSEKEKKKYLNEMKLIKKEIQEVELDVK